MIDAEGVRTRLAFAGSSEVPMETLASLFVSRCQAYPDQPAYAFVRDTLELAQSITYAELHEQVCRVAAAIVRHTRLGDRVLLVYHPGLDFVRAFWACVVTGRIAVPVPAPDAARFKNSAPRLLTILNDALASLLVTSDDLIAAAWSLQEMQGGGLQTILSTSLPALPPLDGPLELPGDSMKVTPETVAYLQYTSGSTSSPRGVILSHRNVMAQCASGMLAQQMNSTSRVLTWLPHHHDYGLVLGVLWPLYAGAPAHLLSSLTFLRRPLRWLDAIDRFRITHSGGPNFSYAACVRAAVQQPEWIGNLATLQTLSCGAEPIQLETLDAFCGAFVPRGLSPRVFMPSFGMAEAVLGITAVPIGRGHGVEYVDSAALEAHQVRRQPKNAAGVRAIVNCGPAADGMQVLVVDPQTRRVLPADAVGELWVRGTSVGRGYWAQPEASAETFGAYLFSGEGPFLRTGDFGFIQHGDVFVTGRLKDLIIVRGRNIYPHDLEGTAQSADGALRVGYGAAFSVSGDEGEEVVIVQELERREKGKDLVQVCAAIRKAVAREHELPLRTIVLVQSGSLPRTSSGKIRRRSCRQNFLDGTLSVLHSDITPPSGDCSPAGLLSLADPRDLQHPTERLAAVENLLLHWVAYHARRTPEGLSLDASAVECGLDSLSSLRVHQALETALACQVPTTCLLAGPDLRTVARHLDALMDDARLAAHAAPVVIARHALMPLSAAQQRMWFWQEMAPETALYNITVAMALEGPLDDSLLDDCLTALVQRHEILRMRWVRAGDEQRQRIETSADWQMQRVALHARDGASLVQQADALAAEEARRPFDLTREPAVRATLLSLGPIEHRLLWSVHHSVCDGQSLLVMVEELCSLYTARIEGHPHPLPPVGLQYLDFAAWDTDLLANGVRARELAYWKKHLADAPAFLDLPTDHRRPAQQHFRGASVAVQLSGAQTVRLRSLAQAADATLFMVLLAAWQSLLHRYSGQATVITASVIANRDRAEFDRTVGYFANTLALRSDFTEDLTVEELLTQVKRHALGAFAHHHVSFEEVVDALDLPRDSSRMPLAQTAFVLQPAMKAEHRLGTVSARQTPVLSPVAKFDLTLELRETADGLAGTLEYDFDLFEAATAHRMAGHLTRLLDALGEEPTCRVSELPLIGDDERHRLLHEWNDTHRPCALDVPVHELIASHAAREPRAEAVAFSGRTLSRQELNDAAERLARHLRTLGVGPDVLVGICMERSLEMVVGFLAILKAGGAFVPLDPDQPARRIAYMLDDAGVRVVLTQSHLQDRLPAAGGLVPLCLDTLLPALPADDSGTLLAANRPDDLAYVIYTSGSTGQPKGVMVSHRSLTNTLLWGVDTVGFAAGDRMLHKTTIGFDAILLDLVMPLVAGVTVVMMPPAKHLDSEALVRILREQRITQIFVAPSQLRVLLESDRMVACTALRYVICGGEAMSADLVRAFQRQLPEATLGNFYGPTETAIVATQTVVSGEAWGAHSPVPIGRPIANTGCHVLDTCLQPVPVGVAGELCIDGVGLARGYLNRPELTAERFVAHPFEHGQRMYRTGDLVRWRADGQLDYLGRTDFQVKIRGIRIELGEVESTLKALPDLSDAVVLAREDVPGQKRLVAYLVGAADLAEVEHALRLQLPSAMVPSAFVRLERLPTLSNGKLDRQALPAPNAALLATGRPYLPPEGAVEQSIAGIWATLLSVPRVGRHDSFFELGGHSLIAVRMVDQLRRAGHEVAVRTLFTAPTLSALAAATRPVAEVDRVISSARVAIPPACELIEPQMVALSGLNAKEIALIAAQVAGGAGNIEDIYPLTPLQAGILFHHRLEEEGDIYLVRSVLAFDEASRQAAFLNALQSVVDRHEALRTAVLWEGLPEPMQVVLRQARLPVHEIDVPAGADALDVLRAATDTQRARMALSNAPLMRAFTARDVPGQRWLMALTVHHIVQDHVSLAVMFEEVANTMAGTARPSRRPAPYRDLVALTRGVDPSAHTAYFQQRLGDVSEPTAPFGQLVIAAEGGIDRVARLVVEPARAQHIRQAARWQGVSPAVLFHLAWALVVARTSGRDDVVFGTVLSGRLRESAALERTVGLFINTLPLRVSLAGHSVQTSLAQTQARLAELVQHDLAPLSLAQRCSAVPGQQPLFGAVFNYRHSAANASFSRPEFKGELLPGTTVIDAEERTNYPLGVSVDDLVEGFVIEAQSETGIDVEVVAQMLSHSMQQLVDALETASQKPALELDPIPPHLRRTLLGEWNRTDRAYALEVPVHALIEQQARQTPDGTACIFRGEGLSFLALNERANQLAHLMRRLGVGPDVMVGLCMERSNELVIACLAVLKAGGAFVPIDPEQATDRLLHILQDTAATVVLTQSHLLDRLPDAHTLVHLLCLDTPLSDLRTHDTQDPPLVTTADHLAYVIYTSGSTGRPKGVMVPHRALANHALWSIDTFGIGRADRVLQKTTIGFDAAISDFFIPLMAGATIVLAEPGEHRDTNYLARTLRDERITLLVVVPSQLRLLLEEPALQACECLRHVMSGGEALDIDLARRFHERLPRATLGNFYGPSETTIDATHCAVHGPFEGMATVPIGLPIANVRCHVLDHHDQLVPPGVVGELHIGGAGLARGYLNQPELTAERFVPDPFAPGQRVYRTGDRVRWLPDGRLEYIGRADFQVKIRGIRIELGEIESVLSAIPHVQQAVVMAREDTPGLQRLVAYVVGAEFDTAGMQWHLQHLPPAMVPSALVKLDRLPTLANGKIDRAALPAPDMAAEPRTLVLPADATEQAVWDIWQDLLQHPHFGVHHNFFELGGHSLLAMQVLSRLRGVLQVELPLRALFDAPTIAQLAEKIRDAQRLVPSAPIPQAPPGVMSSLTVAQEGLWFAEKLHDLTAQYNIFQSTRLQGPLDVVALERSLHVLSQRHHNLHSKVIEHNGVPALVRRNGVTWALEHLELPPTAPVQREQALTDLLSEFARRPMDLGRAPLARAALVRIDENEHAVVLVIHHLVCDGWSLNMLLRELASEYDTQRRQVPSVLPALHLDWRDIAYWEQARLRSGELDASLDHWRHKLEGLEPLRLPLEPTATQPDRGAGCTQMLNLPPSLVQGLETLANQHGATVFMVLLAALKSLLARRYGREDVAVGTPVAGRHRPELESTFGLLLNTLVLRTDLRGNPSFSDTLKRVRSTLLEAWAHQELPFETVVRTLSPARSSDQAPFFDVFINAFGPWAGELQLADLHSTPIHLELTPPKFALTLYIDAKPGSIAIAMVTRTDRLALRSVQHLMAQFEGLLQQVVEQPARGLGALSLLTTAAREQLADPSAPLAATPFKPVTQRVMELARQAPSGVAVRHAGREYLYADLDFAARTIARQLLDAGIQSGDVVAVSGPRSFALVASMLGSLMCGGVFLTLDPVLPRSRRKLMLKEARATWQCLIGPDAVADAAAAAIDMKGTIVLSPGLDEWLVPDRSEAPALPLVTPQPDDPAHIFFTSGSTGSPKAVLGRHRSLPYFLDWQRNTFSVGAEDRVSQLIGLSFDPLLRDVFLPLTSGAVLCIPPDRAWLDPVGWLDSERVSIVHTTPSVMQGWLSSARTGASLPDLRLLFVGGEPLTDALVHAWRQRFGDKHRLVNLYGATETTMAPCFHEIGKVPDRGIQPVGRALPGSQVFVLSASGDLCGIGETGEVVLRTPLCSLGYLHQLEAESTPFRPNPWLDNPTDRLYHTGDRGRMRPDGVLEIAGRLDDQVKIRGVRVEPAEIAAVLARHPLVGQCAVVPHQEGAQPAVLVTYVAPTPGSQLSISDLRSHLAAQLPESFLPAAIVVLDALPLQANGKVDRRRLPPPLPAAQRTDTGRALTMPRSPVEQALWDIWRSVLRDAPFGVFENFFELGGHSLLVTQVVARIRDVLGIELPLRALFETPTIAQLSTEVEHRLQGASADVAPLDAMPVRRVARGELLPTSYSQRRMWLVQQFNPETTAYNMPFALRLRGPLDADVMVSSLQRLTARHEAFRTTLVAVDGEPMQRIGPREDLTVERVDLRHLPAHERANEAARLLSKRSLQTYDLARGPLHRPTLLCLDDHDHVLYWSVHHAIGDGWSAGILMSEMAIIYPAVQQGREPALAPLVMDFADYASWQRQTFGTTALAHQLVFWKEALNGLEPLPLPLDRPRRGANKGSGARAFATFHPQLLVSLKHRAAEHNATPYMLLLACFQLLLGRYCGVTDVAVGTPIANRTQVSAEHLVGTLVNTVVMRTNLAGDITFVDLLQRVRETALQAYAHQDLPFEALVEAMDIPRHSDTAPLVQVLFNVLTPPQTPQPIEGLSYEPFEFDTGSTQFDLALSIDTHQFGHAQLSYSTEVFEPATGERLLGAFMALVERVIADPDARLASIDLIDNESRDRLVTWNDTAAETGTALTVSDLLGRQAGQSPTAIALEQPGLGSLPYAGLESRANQLARALRARGIGRGALVGLCVERGIDMVVAQLAILKSGAAYVPLDPAYPADRLAHMAEDAKLSLLVTESALVHALNWPRAESLLLDIDASEIASQSNEAMFPDAAHDARPEDPAYVIYTSGSTGKPKGVVVPHTAVVNFLVSMAREPGLTARDTLVAVTTLSFDIAVLELLLPLSVGARVVLANRAQTLDGSALRSLLEVSGATVMQATPSTWRVLIDSGWQGSLSFKALIGGEGLPADLAVQLLARTAELWNMYGPTETTVWSTCCQVTEPEHGISIGRPIANTTVHILDEHQCLCPIGVAGEIYIGGAGVTLGYLHRPELTDERFVLDPFVSGARLYRTGDRGRWRHDGMLEHLGRLDFQVKVRGHRIELGEIESQLGMLPEIARTVVIVREDVLGDVRLVAYVVAQKTLPEAQWLRDQLRRSLPDYMVPQHFIEIPAIPLLPNGKIDRRALPAPTETSHHAARDFVAPHTVTEHAVAAVWTRLLGVPRVGVTDNFFDLGGHSLLAMRAVAELNKRPGAHLTVRQLIFDNLGQIATSLPEAAASHEDIASAGSPDGVGDAPAGWLSRLMDRLR